MATRIDRRDTNKHGALKGSRAFKRLAPRAASTTLVLLVAGALTSIFVPSVASPVWAADLSARIVESISVTNTTATLTDTKPTTNSGDGKSTTPSAPPATTPQPSSTPTTNPPANPEASSTANPDGESSGSQQTPAADSGGSNTKPDAPEKNSVNGQTGSTDSASGSNRVGDTFRSTIHIKSNGPVQPEDTFAITFPAELRTTGGTFPLTDDSNRRLAECVLSAGNSPLLTCAFTAEAAAVASIDSNLNITTVATAETKTSQLTYQMTGRVIQVALTDAIGPGTAPNRIVPPTNSMTWVQVDSTTNEFVVTVDMLAADLKQDKPVTVANQLPAGFYLTGTTPVLNYAESVGSYTSGETPWTQTFKSGDALPDGTNLTPKLAADKSSVTFTFPNFNTNKNGVYELQYQVQAQGVPSGEYNNSVVINDVIITAKAGYRNPFNGSMYGPGYGGIKLSKEIVGAAAAAVPTGMEYTIQITLPGGEKVTKLVNVSQPLELAYSAGTEITLAENLPMARSGFTWGTPKFSSSSPGVTVAADGSTVKITIQDGTSTELQLTNTANLPVLSNSNLKLDAKIGGTGASQVPADTQYTVELATSEGVTSEATISLSQPATVQFPVGTKITLSAKAPAATSAYTWSPPKFSSSSASVAVATDGSQATVTITDGVEAEVSITNTATLRAVPTLDANLMRDSGFSKPSTLGASSTLENQPENNAAAPTIDANTVRSGDKLQYQISVKADPDSAAVDVKVEDALPVGVAYAGTYVASRGIFDGKVWFIGDMAANEEATIAIDVVVKPAISGTVLTDTSKLTANANQLTKPVNVETKQPVKVENPEPPVGPGIDVKLLTETENLQAASAAADSIEKPRKVSPGDKVRIGITVKNPKAAIEDVTVDDVVPAGLVYKGSYVASQGKYDGLTWNIGDLASGAEATLEIDVVVQPATAGKIVTDSAQLFVAGVKVPDAAGNNPGSQGGMNTEPTDGYDEVSLTINAVTSRTAALNVTPLPELGPLAGPLVWVLVGMLLAVAAVIAAAKQRQRAYAPMRQTSPEPETWATRRRRRVARGLDD